MAMTFLDHMKQLIEKFKSCEWHTAQAITWQAVMAVYAEHPWSFCVKEGRITTQAAYRTGKVALVNGQQSVTAVSGAVFDPTWQMLRFVGPGRNEEYDVVINNAGLATLSQKWLGETTAEGDYVMFRDAYPVPADCNYGREYYILDPPRGRVIRFKDLGPFIREKTRRAAVGTPEWVTRVGIDPLSGSPLLRFGPEAPSTVEGYPTIYYAKPLKPANVNTVIMPLIPEQFEDMIWRRARWMYAEEKGKNYRERDDLRRIYWDRHYEAVTVCDGGSEVHRVIATQFESLYSDFASSINFAIEDED